MATSDKIEAYFSKENAFKECIARLRELALKTGLEETLKWGAPVYTINGKNVLSIMAFQNHCGLWFFNGVYLKDPKNLLAAAQKGTKAMRHWKFTSLDEIEPATVLAYMIEAVENQKKGIAHKPQPAKKTKIPPLLAEALAKDSKLQTQFKALTPYKQREFCEHIGAAKQEKTRQNRLQKSIPLIKAGIALHDKYRKH